MILHQSVLGTKPIPERNPANLRPNSRQLHQQFPQTCQSDAVPAGHSTAWLSLMTPGPVNLRTHLVDFTKVFAPSWWWFGLIDCRRQGLPCDQAVTHQGRWENKALYSLIGGYVRIIRLPTGEPTRGKGERVGSHYLWKGVVRQVEPW